MTEDDLNRRRVLALTGTTLATGFAGCAGGDGASTPTGAPETPRTPAGTTTATETDQPTTAAEDTEGDDRTADGGAYFGAYEGETTVVEMRDTRFAPVRVSVEAGTTVEWVNRDFYGHDVVNITFDDAAANWDFQSRTIREGETVRYTFEEPGVYEYYCQIHGEGAMCGAVLVGDVSLDEELLCER